MSFSKRITTILQLRVSSSWTRFKWVLLLLALTTGLLACGDQATSQYWTETQCFKPLDDTSYPRRNELYQDTERGCWGQRWAIPEKYLPYKQAKLTEAETIILYIDVMAVFDPKAARTPRKERDWQHAVQVRAITHAGFEAQRLRKQNLPLKGFRKTGQSLFGFELYEDGDITQYRNIYFFSEAAREVYARCIVRAGEEIEQKSPQATCKIFTHINNKFDVEYLIPYDAMGELVSINSAVRNHLEALMIAN